MKGTIARKHPNGYGFITPETGEKDIFFHANEVNGATFDELNEGDAVTFEIANGPKGPAATNVQRA
jgi:CspA family cold shock protein